MTTWRVEDGDICFAFGCIATLSGADCLRQRLENRIKLFKREWFLCPTEGIDWPAILGQKSSMFLVYAEIKRALLADEEVEAIVSLEADFANQGRKLTVTFLVSSIYGEINGGTDL